MSYAPHRHPIGTWARSRRASGPPAATAHCGPVWLLAATLAAGGCMIAGGRDGSPAIDSPKLTLGGGGDPARVRQTIPLELSFVRCDPHDEVLRDELWQFIDEQVLPADLRRRLAANGLRAGIVGTHLPPHLAARFAAADVESTAGPLPTEATVTRRLMRLLPGRRGEIVTASGIAELVLLEQAGGTVRGGTYRDASPLFAVEARPAADGRVHVEVTPEIRHGPIEKSWVGEDGTFRLESGQRRHRLDDVRFAVTLPREGMLVIGCGGDGSGTAGDCLLRDHDRGSGASVRLLAIRPLADTVDPLFAPAAEPDASGDDDQPLVVR